MQRFIFILILLCGHAIAHATLTMQITPSTARFGETLQLTLTLDGMSNASPDLAPLEKDFTLAGTEHNVSYTAANGVAKSESQWIILLIPKKSGVITIPSIQIGQQKSASGQVTITTGTKTRTSSNEPVMPDDDAVLLQAEASTREPFINQQMIYTVKLYSRKPLMNAEYHPPRVEDALLISLGEGRRYQTTLNGHEYGVDEQLYAIFSQKSGQLNITPPEFDAMIYDTVPRRIHVDGPTINIVTKPIPDTSTMPWLPAKKVILTEHYQSPASTMTQGNTLVRTITLRAVAMPAELLPAITFEDNKPFSTYPEKPETSNKLNQNELIGTSSVKVTYLLNQAGHITLPAIKLAWFNTVTGKQEIATLPEHELTVIGKSGTQAIPPTTTKQSHQTTITKRPALKNPVKNHITHQLTWWLAATGAMLAFVITYALWRYRKRRYSVMKQNMSAANSRLRKACATDDPIKAHAALLAWGRLHWPKVTLLNLSQLHNLVHNIELKKQINLLSQALYSQNKPATWRGNDLWCAVKHYQHHKLTKKIKDHVLPTIHPDTFSE